MKVLVTGATGLVGSYTVKSLLSDGHEVVTYTRSKNSSWLQQLITKEENEHLTMVEGNMLDSEMLRKTIVDNNCEYVAHIAGRMNRVTREDPVGSIQLNVHAFQDLMEICCKEKVKKVVWASSTALYGLISERKERYGEEYSDVWMNEKTPYCPGSLYSYTKEFLEGMSKYYREYHDLDTVALRVNLIYGPYINSSFTPFFSSIIDKPALGLDSEVPFSEGEFDWQYVGDMGDMFRAVLKAPKNNTCTYQTRGILAPVSEGIKIIKEILPEVNIKGLPGKFDTPFKYDASLFEKEIGYKPTTGIREGLIKSINMVREKNGLPLIEG